MKRATAIRYSVEVARRLHSINGLLATPICRNEFVKISRVWVFGSTAKGSQNPNDLDLMIEIKECGRHKTWRQSTVDKRYHRSYGIRAAPESRDYALKWLTKGMKLVSRHCTDSDPVVLDVKTMIYPRFELAYDFGVTA